MNITKIAKQDAVLKALVSDLSGNFCEIIFPIRALPVIIGPGIAYDGSSFSGINMINSSDALLQGDPESIMKVPSPIADTEKDEYWIVCNIMDTEGNTHPNCARGALIRLQKELAKKWDGGNMYMGAEPEAFFISKSEKNNVGASGGGNSNYLNPKDDKSKIIVEMTFLMDEMGFEIERSHTEVGDDQFEVNWRFDKAERTADKIQIFKLLAHKVARQHGYDVTFLPKPYPSRNGSGMHCHISVQNKKQNLYYDAKNTSKKNFSDMSLKFLTGILTNARSIAAIANPTEASYARLVPGFEAPCIIAIGDCNRSAACRIPAISDPKLKKVAIRTEFRFPDPLANPYFLAAGFIAAGIEGIDKKMKFQGFTDENLYEYDLQTTIKKGYQLLPRNLWEAYQEFSKNPIMKKAFGASLFDAYSDILIDEIDSCQPFANSESIRRHYLA